MAVVVRLFGSPELRLASGWVPLPLDKRGGLLAFLAREGSPVQRLRVAKMFWPDLDEGRARTNLRALLTRLRVLQLPCDLQLRDDALAWPVETDTGAFDRAYARGEWPAAVESYTGPLLGDVFIADAPAFNGWVDLERRLLEERYADAAGRLAATLVDSGRADRAIEVFRRLLERDALDDRAVSACLALATREATVAADALRIYDSYARRLETEIGLAPDPELRSLAEAARRTAGGPRAGAPSVASSGHVLRLPHPIGGQVTREADVVEVIAALRTSARRAVTLVGPGGIGKSVLAAMVARAAGPSFADGAVWVPLSGLKDASLVAARLAEALGLSVPDEEGLEATISRALRHRNLLLVLDDLDGLLDAVPFIGRLLEACEGVRALATSRRTLASPLDVAIEVPGLSYPQKTEEPRALDHAAVRLFSLRARQVKPDFVFEPKVAKWVVAICRLVDGSPLGIELAAGASGVRPLAEIVDELERDLGAMHSDLRNAPTRHTSLRAAFEHTWNLLGDEERSALGRLSLLLARFDMETAMAVAETDASVLLTLVDWSLLKRGTDGRFELHPLVRQFAAEALARDPVVEEEARSRHAPYFRRLVQSNQRWMRGGAHQRDALEAIGKQLEDVHTAWDFYLSARDRSSLESFVPVLHYYEIRGLFALGEARFAATVAAAEGKSILRARALLAQSVLAGRARLWERCRETIEECCALMSELNVEDAFAPLHRGVLEWAANDRESAKRYWLEAVETARRSGDAWSLAGSLANLGMEALDVGDLERAKSLGEEAVAIFASLEDHWGQSICNNDLGQVALARGHFDEARDHFSAGLDHALSIDQWPVVLDALDFLGQVASKQGRTGEAAALREERSRVAREHGLEYLLVD